MTPAYFEDGTPRLGFDRATVRAFPSVTPWFGRCRSRRNTIQAAMPMMPATPATRQEKPQIIHSMLIPSGVCRV